MVISTIHRPATPRSLGELISNQCFGQVRLARPEELLALARTIPKTEVFDTELANWRAVYFAALYGQYQFERVHLLGDSLRNGIKAKISSPVLAMDTGTGLAVTRSGSVYRLHGVHGQGEPPPHQIHIFCAALWAWGHGEKLGVSRPEF